MIRVFGIGRRDLCLGAAAAALALTGLIPQPVMAASPAEVKIGAVLPLSGRYAEIGSSSRRGIDLIVDQVNAAGGIKSMGGAKIKLVVADDGSEPTKASLEARRLIAQEKVSFILGPYSTPEAEGMVPVLERSEVGGVGLITTMIPQTPYFSIMSIPAAKTGDAYVDAVLWLKAKGVKADNIVLTYANNDYGQTVAKEVTIAAQQAGLKILEDIPVTPGTKDMTPIVLKIKALNPDAVIAVYYLPEGVLFHRARYNLNYEGPVMVGGISSFTDDRLWTLLTPEVAEKTLTKAFGLALFSPEAPLPAMDALVAKAKAAYPDHTVDQSLVIGAQAMLLLDKALENAKTAEPKALAKAFRAVHLTKGDPAIVLPIVPADFSFDEHGIPAGTAPLFVQWKDGKKVIVLPEVLAQAKPVWK